MGGVGPGKAPDPGSIVVAESRWQAGILFGLLVSAFAVALARGVAGARSTAGQVGAAVFCGALVVAFTSGYRSIGATITRIPMMAATAPAG